MGGVAPDLSLRTIRAGHWVPRSHPAEIAAWIAEHATKTWTQVPGHTGPREWSGWFTGQGFSRSPEHATFAAGARRTAHRGPIRAASEPE